MKLLFVINSLQIGGAERVLLGSAEKFLRHGHSVRILTLIDCTDLLVEYPKISPFVKAISLRYPWRIISCLYFLRKSQPDVVCTLLYYSDFIGAILAKIIGCKKIIWWIHNQDTSVSVGFLSFVFSRINALLSNILPSGIIYCSESARESHFSIGYKNKNNRIVSNIPDISRFKYSEKSRVVQRKKLGFGINDVVIGFFCRWDLCKNHAGFLSAISKVEEISRVKILLIGSGLTEVNHEFISLVESYKKILNISYIDGITNLAPFYSAIDIFVQFSQSESFGLCLCEAISSECFSISSRVGIADLVLAEEYLVDPGDEVQLIHKINFAIKTHQYNSIKIKENNKYLLNKMILNNNSYENLCEILL